MRCVPSLRALTLLFCLSSSQAAAETPQGLAVAMLSGSDGTVRTQAHVKLSVSAIPGAPDHAVAMGQPVSRQMPALRACFGEAMARRAGIKGQVAFEVQALPQGRTRVRLARDDTGDRQLASCMRASLSNVNLSGVPTGARSLVQLQVESPSAQLGERSAKQAKVPLRLLPNGRAESSGATQQGEVQFRISGSAHAQKAIEGLHRDVTARFAGLLDCRRKAGRRAQSARGTIKVDVRLERGRVARARPQQERALGPKAPACVVAWLQRAESEHLVPAELELAITFAGD